MQQKIVTTLAPKFCKCCWRPVTQKNKRGHFEKYCHYHKPSGETKSCYMKARRSIEKVYSREYKYEELQSNESKNKRFSKQLKEAKDITDKLNHLISAYTTDPTTLSIKEVSSAKSLINELLKVTKAHYPLTHEHLKVITNLLEQSAPAITTKTVLIATHFALGSKNQSVVLDEIKAYDVKMESEVWFNHLLITIARFEAFAIIEIKEKEKTTRSDKDLKLRQTIQNEINKAKIANIKPNQTAIAKTLNISKQRVGKLIKEMHQAQKGDRKCDRLTNIK